MLCALALLLALPTYGQDVTFTGAGGLELKGSLTMPEKPAGAVPAVLLLPGSGPTDRDGNQPPLIVTDLLKQVSEKLVEAGIATLRYDKRAVRIYTDRWPKDLAALNEFFSWEHFVGDAKGGLDYLRKQKGIDPKRIFVAGHSEGGLIAAQIASDTAGKPDAPFGLVLMAAPGRTMDQLIREQVAASLIRSGLSESGAKPYNDFVDRAIGQIKLDGTAPPDPPLGLAAVFPPSALKLLRAYFLADPPRLLAKFEGPVLVIQGEKDIQVSATRDAAVLEKALEARPKGSVELLVVPSASHNLKHVDDPNKEPAFAGPVVKEALDKIAEWLLRHSKP